MRYLEWVETVLRIAVEGSRGVTMFGLSQIATRTALGRWDNPDDRARDGALADAIDDLDSMRLLESADTYAVAPTKDARRYSTHPLSDVYPREREGHLEPDEERFLAELAELSEVEHDGWAEVRRLTSREVFDALGWPWDRTLSLRITSALQAFRFAHVQRTNDMDNPRLAFAGAVRVRDEPTMMLAEARDHLALGRARAAGCIAGVELERRLKARCAAIQPPVQLKADQSMISRYNDALRKAKIYPFATWRKVQVLGDLRNLCAHVLDAEPSVDDARQLVEGTEEILRTVTIP